jgi:hypothetical protein
MLVVMSHIIGCPVGGGRKFRINVGLFFARGTAIDALARQARGIEMLERRDHRIFLSTKGHQIVVYCFSQFEEFIAEPQDIFGSVAILGAKKP